MEKELEIYYDHYKDSFTHLRTYLKQRDRYFYICVVLLALLFLNMMLPGDFEQLSKEYLKKSIGLEKYNNLKLINSFLLFCMLSVSIKYFQVNLLIERQYVYLHHIEKMLSRKLEHFNIFREGRGYLQGYPIFGSIVHRIYTIVFPLLLMLLVYIKWKICFQEVNNFQLISFFSFDSLIICAIEILTLFYLLWIHFKDFKRCCN